MDTNAALDFIWSNRTDLKPFYISNGWDVSTFAGQRAAVLNWLGMTPEAKIITAGRDPVKSAQALGASGGGGDTPPGVVPKVDKTAPSDQWITGVDNKIVIGGAALFALMILKGGH